jgi:hypothetical protein
MSNRPRLNHHHSTFHAFLLAAKEKGYSDFQLRLVANQNGRIEFTICPRGRSETAKFEVRGNMLRAAANVDVIPMTDHAPVIDYGGTRSGERPVEVVIEAPAGPRTS